MVALNIVFITGIVVGILGLLAWGIVSDRPFATYLSQRAVADQAGLEWMRADLSRPFDLAAGPLFRFALLRVAGCSQAQGYLFSRPVPAAQLDFSRAEARPIERAA